MGSTANATGVLAFKAALSMASVTSPFVPATTNLRKTYILYTIIIIKRLNYAAVIVSMALLLVRVPNSKSHTFFHGFFQSFPHRFELSFAELFDHILGTVYKD